jgi:hypothetical protein
MFELLSDFEVSENENLNLNLQSVEDSVEFATVFDGVVGANLSAGNCTGCGNSLFFAIKLAV